jgi:DNA-binding MarR family transcriptional regulator
VASPPNPVSDAQVGLLRDTVVALVRRGELDLARRKVDPLDRRSVLVQRTTKGSAFLRDLRNIMTEASGGAKKASKKVAA